MEDKIKGTGESYGFIAWTDIALITLLHCIHVQLVIYTSIPKWERERSRVGRKHISPPNATRKRNKQVVSLSVSFMDA
jgi:hypothetical protein